jgi:hypothetical protein
MEPVRAVAPAVATGGTTSTVAEVVVWATTDADATAEPEGVTWRKTGPFAIATVKVFAAGAGRPAGALKATVVPGATEIPGDVERDTTYVTATVFGLPATSRVPSSSR